MAGDVENPRVWLGADVYAAPLATAAPTDVATALAAAWVPLGLLSQDGLNQTREESSTDMWAWGSILVRTIRTQQKWSFTVTALEDNPVVFGLLNPGSEQDTTGGLTTRTIKVGEPDPRAFVFELRDGEYTKRIIIPRGEVQTPGSPTYTESGMTMYELTVTVYPAADGDAYTEITDDPAAVVVP